ncbi:MAG: UvrD-helicase domain-containing protein [Acidimicrobiales bacterium]
MDGEALLAGLDTEQRHAVTTASQPLVIRAGAGSGKTRVLTRRVAYRAAQGDLEPGHALCVTFTREAASELRGRLRRLGLRELPAAGTFHSVAFSLLRARWHDLRQPEPELLADRRPMLARIAGVRAGGATLVRVAAEIDWAKARGVKPDRYRGAVQRQRRSPNVDLALVETLYSEFEAAKRKARLVDFDDLLERCTEAFNADPAFAAAQRWRFRHLFVDEFQDVTPQQFRLLQAWLGESRDLCVVGDANQAIYGWNGADPTLFARLVDLLEGGEVVELSTNHRSSPSVVAAAGAALAAGRAPKAATHRSEGSPPRVRACADAEDEVRTIAAQLRDWHNGGVPWRSQAVLVRTNALAISLADGLAQHGLPTTRLGANTTELLRRLPPLGADLSWADVVAELADPALATLVAEYEALDLRPSVAGFLRWAATATADEGVTGDAIRVGTFHRAKGREWQAVVVAGVEDGFVPASAIRLEEERNLFYVALSRPTDHLCCTWAASRVVRGQVVARQPSPFLAPVQASAEAALAADAPRAMPPTVALTIDRLGLARKDSPAPAAPLPGSRQTLSERRALRLAQAQQRRLQALQAWRAAQAKAARVAPRVLLEDATLQALAADPPPDQATLALLAGVGPIRARRFGPALLAALHGAS